MTTAPTAAPATSAPATETRAPATPSPTPGPDVAAFVAAAMAVLRDPGLAARFDLGGTQTISGTVFDTTGQLVVAGPDMATKTLLQPYDIRTGQISTGGAVYLEHGDGRWTRDDQPPAPMPAFADAFAGEVTAGPWIAGSRPDDPDLQVNLVGVDLDTLLAATGMVDPGTTGATGTVAMFLSDQGEVQALVIEATASPGEGLEASEVLRAMVVTSLAKVGDPGAPSVTSPKDFWLRHYSKDLAYLIPYPPTLKQSTADDTDHFRDSAPHDFQVFGGTLPEGATLNGVVADEIKRLKAGGFKVTSDEKTTIDGVPARKITLTGKSGGESYWVVKVMTAHESVFYALTWVDLAARRKTGQPVLEEMLAGFHSAY